MKKIALLFLSILTIVIPFFSNIEGIATDTPLKLADVQMQLNIPFKDKQVARYVNDIVLLPKDINYNIEDAKGMIIRISQIHPLILKFLSENNLTIQLFTGRLTDQHGFEHLSGTTPRGWSNNLTWDDVPGGCNGSLAVAKIGASEKGMGHSSINLELHEMGHLFERNYVIVQNDTWFQQISKEESAVLLPGYQYFHSYQNEYFAEAFAMYYLNKESRNTLKQNAPNTYAFLEKIEKNLSYV